MFSENGDVEELGFGALWEGVRVVPKVAVMPFDEAGVGRKGPVWSSWATIPGGGQGTPRGPRPQERRRPERDVRGLGIIRVRSKATPPCGQAPWGRGSTQT